MSQCDSRLRPARLPARRHVGLLVLLAALLVLDGPAVPAADAGAASPAAALAQPPLDADAIARRLAAVNPDLTPSELRRMGTAVVRCTERHALDPTLVTAVLLVESGARPWAVSPKGALGLMQVMPYMMRGLELAGSPSTIETNIEAGCTILAGNIRRLGEEDGISAYFWGSEIRGVSYLNRVQAARERVRRELRS
jgi:soluble lytic murein transglycosylase-like protein